MNLKNYSTSPPPEEPMSYRDHYWERRRWEIISSFLSLGIAAGLFGPYITQDYDQSLWCLRYAALTYWIIGAWLCLGSRKATATPAAGRRWRKILVVTSIAGVPAMSAFTPLLEPLRDHPKLFGLVSFLFYLFAVLALVVAAFMAAHKPRAVEAPPG